MPATTMGTTVAAADWKTKRASVASLYLDHKNPRLGRETLAQAPREIIFTTLGRVFDSTVGPEYLHIEKDADHGLRGTTAKSEFVKAFTKLVSDVAVGTQSSRALNSSEDIQKYFKGWKPSEKPAKTKASFVPAEVIQGKSVASPAKPASAPAVKKTKAATATAS